MLLLPLCDVVNNISASQRIHSKMYMYISTRSDRLCLSVRTNAWTDRPQGVNMLASALHACLRSGGRADT